MVHALNAPDARRSRIAKLILATALLVPTACSVKNITTTPDDVTLYLNQTAVSSEELIELARPGDTITAKRTGYFDQTITVRSFRDRELAIELVPMSFKLSISVEQHDPILTIDDEPTEYSNAGHPLTYGSHTVVVGKAGYESVSR